MQQAPPQSYSEHDRPESERCPTCGAGAEPGQLVCLECGSRISLGYRKPPTWRLPVAIIALVAIVVVGALALGLREITQGADTEVARNQAADKPADQAPSDSGASGGSKAQSGGGGETLLGTNDKKAKAEPKSKPKAKKPAAKKKKPAAKPEAPAAPRGGVASWPKNRNGFTPVLLSAGDKASATSVAKQAARDGVRGAGVLRSDDFSSLGKGVWIVFGGVYRTRPQAERAAERFSKGFPGAFVQFVNGAARGSRG